MNRSMAVFVAVLAMAVQGCSSMNVFGGADTRDVAPASTNAPDAEKPPTEKARLSRFDGNKDGLVQKAELEATLEADFKLDDADNNETLDAAEMRVVNERLRADSGMSPIFDWNADGRLVYGEYATQWRTLFDRTDRNGDGVVDADEIKYSGRERKLRPLPQPTFSGKDGRPPGAP
jgi:EF hand